MIGNGKIMVGKEDVKHRRLFRSGTIGPGLVLAIAIFLGRVSGLAREMTLAAIFGVGVEGDLAILLLTIPDIMVALIIAGGISAAFVPRLSRLDADEGALLLRFSATVIAVLFGLIGAVCAFVPEFIILLGAPGYLSTAVKIDPWFAMIVGFSLPFAALSGVAGGYLNAKGRFFLAGIGTLTFNTTVIAALLFLAPSMSPLLALVYGVFAGAVIRLLPQALPLVRDFFGSGWLPAGWQAYAKDFAAGLTATGLLILSPVIIRAGASYFGEGSFAVVNYAQKLIELPVGVLFGAICTVALTDMSNEYAQGGHDKAVASFKKHIRLTVQLGMIALVAALGFSGSIVDVLFGYGRINNDNIAQISEMFAIGAFSIPLAGLSLLTIGYLNATERTGLVLRSSLISIAFTMICLVLIVAFGKLQYLMILMALMQLVTLLVLKPHAGSALNFPFLARSAASSLTSVLPLVIVALICGAVGTMQSTTEIFLCALAAVLGLVGAWLDWRKAQ